MEVAKHKTVDSQLERFSFYKQLKSLHLDREPVEFCITVLVIILLFNYAIRPTVTTIKTLTKTINELKLLNSKLETKKTNLGKLDIEYQLVKNDLALVDEALPDKHEFKKLEEQVRFYVNNSGLTVNSIDFSGFDLITNDKESMGEKLDDKPDNELIEAKISEKLEVIKVNAQVSGEYENIKLFIHSLEKGIRLIQTRGVDLIREQEKVIGASVKFYVYYMKPNEE